MSRSNDQPVISDDETMQLLRALGRGQAEFTTEEGERVYQWAHLARINAGLLDLLLEGLATVRIRDDGELLFSVAGAE